MAGKLTKVAAGELMTHSARSQIDPAYLARVTLEVGGSPALADEIRTVRTARHAFELWQQHGLTAAPDLVCAHAETTMSDYVKAALPVRVLLIDFPGEQVVGRSPSAAALASRPLPPTS